MMAPGSLLVASLALSIAAAGCSASDREKGPQVLGGVSVSASILESGRRVYARNCAPCHGEAGDGRGPASSTSWPPPRDFTIAKFKFAGIEDRGLPADDELARIISGGLAGSSMPAWELPASELADVIDYIKTFSPPGSGFRDPSLAVSPPALAADPFLDPAARAGAIAEGERLYHDVFECAKCHPSYREGGRRVPVAKWSDTYQAIVLPTDFGRHPMRSVRRGPGGAADLYRVIAYGLQGPMPGYLHLGSDNIWAVAHYVDSISE